MKQKILNNEKGLAVNIIMAIALTIISMVSIVTFSTVAVADSLRVVHNQDMVQEDILIRSEMDRIPLMLKPDLSTLLGREVEIKSPDPNRAGSYHRITTYALENKLVSSNDAQGKKVRVIKTLATAKRSYSYTDIQENVSPVIKCYARNYKLGESLNKFLYITDKECSDISNDPASDAGQVCFWGPDVLDGPVHSNSDIYLQNGGGGNNDGWPTFLDSVTTTGIFKLRGGANLFPTPPPGFDPDEVFRGGYRERVQTKNFLNVANEIRENGDCPIGAVFESNKDICVVKIEGNGYKLITGDITDNVVKPFNVYVKKPNPSVKSYPDAFHPNVGIGDSVWVNNIAIKDTLWGSYNQPSLRANTSVWIPAELWIEGSISGRTCFGSLKNAYTTGDITYYSLAEQGHAVPDMFTQEMFGLVSEEKILVRYKYRVPFFADSDNFPVDNNGVNHSNSTSPTGHVYLYGAYAALATGNPALGLNAWRSEGVFTYEYQHPHGAPTDFRGISPFTGVDTVFTYIDFHKYKWPPDNTGTGPNYWKKWPYMDDPTGGETSYPLPPTATYPWYPCSDWPWYSPVWPERRALNANSPNPDIETVYERGTLHVYGSIAQRRRGFIHRSGEVGDDNPDMGAWDPANYKFGPSHPSTGYKKDYKYDPRFEDDAPPDFPVVFQGQYDARYSFNNLNSYYLNPLDF